jgi:multisubunit Na+/H+ antiporter MnhB subunit
MLGFISNLVYLIYPAGVMWFAIHPLSYRVVQTLVFHAVMAVYGFLLLVYERDKIEIQKCYRDLMVVVGLTVWALLGNYVYNGTSEGYSHFFNWFFVVQDPFNMFPAQIAPFLMPVLNIALFFGVEMLIHIVLLVVKRVAKRRGLCYPQN